MHDWCEQFGDFSEVFSEVSQLVEERRQSLEILKVLICLSASSLNLLLELAERSSVGGFVLLEELKNLLDSLRVKLIANCVQVV